MVACNLFNIPPCLILIRLFFFFVFPPVLLVWFVTDGASIFPKEDLYLKIKKKQKKKKKEKAKKKKKGGRGGREGGKAQIYFCYGYLAFINNCFPYSGVPVSAPSSQGFCGVGGCRAGGSERGEPKP